MSIATHYASANYKTMYHYRHRYHAATPYVPCIESTEIGLRFQCIISHFVHLIFSMSPYSGRLAPTLPRPSWLLHWQRRITVTLCHHRPTLPQSPWFPDHMSPFSRYHVFSSISPMSMLPEMLSFKATLSISKVERLWYPIFLEALPWHTSGLAYWRPGRPWYDVVGLLSHRSGCGRQARPHIPTT